jgi:prophage tail gpP-like protein
VSTEKIDPAAVKPGDTVTLSRGKSSATAEVTHVQNFIHLEHLGRFRVKGLPSDRTSGYAEYTLTAHQPAPEPEPEWKPGTVADITVHPSGVLRAVRARAGNYWAADTEEVYSDDEVESVRPLVVIDPADVDVVALQREIDDAMPGHEASVVLERLGLNR